MKILNSVVLGFVLATTCFLIPILLLILWKENLSGFSIFLGVWILSSVFLYRSE